MHTGANERNLLDHAEPAAPDTGGLSLAAQKGEGIPLGHLRGFPWFELRFLPNEEVIVRICYIQKAHVKNGTYILTTTKPWRAPLEEGIYRMIPAGVRITSSNYRLGEHGKGVLGFTRTCFMPEADWSFSWALPNNRSQGE
jgi:hypothetical protein